LVSNIVVSHPSVEKDAEADLTKLLAIRDNIGDKDAKHIIHDSLEDLESNGYSHLRVELDTPDGGVLSENVEVWFPAVWYKAPELDSENEPFNQARNLDELSKIWDTVALTTKFWKLDRPKLFFLRIRNFPETETGLLAHEIPENPPASTLSQAAPAIELAPNGSPKILGVGGISGGIEIVYDSSALFADAASQEKLMRIFKLPENKRGLLKEVQFWAFWDAANQPFCPAVELDALLGKKRDFAEAFPNLSKLPETYQRQTLRSLSASLKESSEKTERGREIDFFGTKIPSSFFAFFGLPALIIFLFQFWALGFYLTSKVDSLELEQASQWSFLLGGWPFFILSLLALLLLPLTASILSFLFIPGENLLPKPLNLSLVIAVVVCSAGAFCALQILRERVSPNLALRKSGRRSP
jgi:hypothetical protein